MVLLGSHQKSSLLLLFLRLKLNTSLSSPVQWSSQGPSTSRFDITSLEQILMLKKCNWFAALPNSCFLMHWQKNSLNKSLLHSSMLWCMRTRDSIRAGDLKCTGMLGFVQRQGLIHACESIGGHLENLGWSGIRTHAWTKSLLVSVTLKGPVHLDINCDFLGLESGDARIMKFRTWKFRSIISGLFPLWLFFWRLFHLFVYIIQRLFEILDALKDLFRLQPNLPNSFVSSVNIRLYFELLKALWTKDINASRFFRVNLNSDLNFCNI